MRRSSRPANPYRREETQHQPSPLMTNQMHRRQKSRPTNPYRREGTHHEHRLVVINDSPDVGDRIIESRHVTQSQSSVSSEINSARVQNAAATSAEDGATNINSVRDEFDLLPDNVLVKIMEGIERPLVLNGGSDKQRAGTLDEAPYSLSAPTLCDGWNGEGPARKRTEPASGGHPAMDGKRRKATASTGSAADTPLYDHTHCAPAAVKGSACGGHSSDESESSMERSDGVSLTQMVEEDQAALLSRDAKDQRIKSILVLHRNSMEQLINKVYHHVRRHTDLPLGDKPRTLHETMQVLRRMGVLSKTLFESMEFFRTHGNNAAHDDGRCLLPTRQCLEREMEIYKSETTKLKQDLGIK